VNLADKQSGLRKEAQKKYAEWHQHMMATMPEGWGDPLDTVLEEGGPYHARGPLKKYCERLEQTGRGGLVAELKKRHPREFQLTSED